MIGQFPLNSMRHEPRTSVLTKSFSAGPLKTNQLDLSLATVNLLPIQKILEEQLLVVVTFGHQSPASLTDLLHYDVLASNHTSPPSSIISGVWSDLACFDQLPLRLLNVPGKGF